MSAPASVTDGARARLAKAQGDYYAALEEGADTTAARDRLRRARADATVVQAQVGRAAEQVEAGRRQALQSAAASEAREAEQQVVARLRALVAVPEPNITLPVGVVAGVLDSRHRAAQAEEAAQAARARVLHLQGRQQALEQRRAAIVARRQSGSGNDGIDGPELALIEADSQGLAELLEQASADAAGPARLAVEAAAAISHAEALWGQAVEAATAQALVEICWALEASLVRAAAERYPSRLTGGSAWKASRELRHLIDYGSPMGRLA